MTERTRAHPTFPVLPTVGTFMSLGEQEKNSLMCLATEILSLGHVFEIQHDLMKTIVS